MFRIDSFKIRIAKDKISDLQNILKRFQNLQIKRQVSNDGGITSFALQLERQRTSRGVEDYISLKVSSKLLKERYYDCITKDTLKYIVEYINSVGVTITEEELLESEVTDIDFCKNIKLSFNKYESLIKHLIKHTEPTTAREKGYRRFQPKSYGGFCYSGRRTATPNNPYIKIYNKKLDSLTLHKDFFIHYGIHTEDNTFRIEYTLKNKKHFDKYKIGNKLKDFLELDQVKLKNIMKDMVDIHTKIYTNSLPEPKRKYQDVQEIYAMFLFEMGDKLGISKHHIVNTIANAIPNRSNRSTFKKKMSKLIYKKLESVLD